MENLAFKIKGNSYNLIFPNIGQFKAIEMITQALSNGMYENLDKTNTIGAQKAARIVEMEALLTILSPKLIEELYGNIRFGDLGIKDFLELESAYKEQILPWWEGILKMVSGQE